MLGIVLLIVLVLILFGGIGPWSPRGPGYGFGVAPFGSIGVILIIIVLVLLFTGRI